MRTIRYRGYAPPTLEPRGVNLDYELVMHTEVWLRPQSEAGGEDGPLHGGKPCGMCRRGGPVRRGTHIHIYQSSLSFNRFVKSFYCASILITRGS